MVRWRWSNERELLAAGRAECTVQHALDPPGLPHSFYYPDSGALWPSQPPGSSAVQTASCLPNCLLSAVWSQLKFSLNTREIKELSKTDTNIVRDWCEDATAAPALPPPDRRPPPAHPAAPHGSSLPPRPVTGSRHGQGNFLYELLKKLQTIMGDRRLFLG